MINRKAFTMIELLFVIVIMGIVGGLALEAIRQYYEGVYKTQTIAKRVSEADHMLDIIAKRFENGIETSIANFDKDNDGFAGVCNGVPEQNDTADYTVVALVADVESQRVQYNQDVGWKERVSDESNGTSIFSQGVNYNLANQSISSRYNYGLNSAAIYNGARIPLDVCSDVYANDGDMYFKIDSFTASRLTTTDNLGQGIPRPEDKIKKYLVASGVAFRAMDDGRFLMFSGFRPWSGQQYSDVEGTVLGTDVASFTVSFDHSNNFVDSGGLWRLKLCMRGLDENLSTTDDSGIAICRERNVNVRY